MALASDEGPEEDAGGGGGGGLAGESARASGESVNDFIPVSVEGIHDQQHASTKQQHASRRISWDFFGGRAPRVQSCCHDDCNESEPNTETTGGVTSENFRRTKRAALTRTARPAIALRVRGREYPAMPTMPTRATAACRMRLSHISLSRRNFGSSARRVLPVARLPTTLFPGAVASLPVLTANQLDRPLHGSIDPAIVDQVTREHDGKLALLCDRLSVGVLVDVRSPFAGVDRSLLVDDGAASTPAANGDTLHVVGGARVALVEMGDRMASGGRLALFEDVTDEPLPAGNASALEDEAIAARGLLSSALEGSGGEGEHWQLELCTLDEELMGHLLEVADPTSHPLFLHSAAVPSEDASLAYWLGSRLPLSTGFRAHLLACTCPLKRMRDVLDALRLLANPNRAGDDRFGKFTLRWQTAEASGCELEAPRCVLDWSRGEDAISRL